MKVVLYDAEEGFGVFCPTLHGCVSQGSSREETLDNIKSAIRKYMEVASVVAKEDIARDTVTYGEVEVDLEGVASTETE